MVKLFRALSISQRDNTQWLKRPFGSLLKLEDDDYGVQYDLKDLQALAKAHSYQGQYQAANDIWLKASTL